MALIKSYLENFELYFASMWDECNCVVVWTSFGIAFLWGRNENWPFPFLWPLLSFPNLLTYWVQHFHSIIFWIWNSSTGIPSPPLALFVLMLPKAHLTSHSRMSGSRWVITPTIVVIWVINTYLYSSSVYSCHLFLISSASVGFLPFFSFIVPIFAWNVSLVTLIFLKTSCTALDKGLKVKSESHSVVWLCDLKEFSSPGYWSWLPFPSLVDLPSPGIKLGSPVLWANSLQAEP